MGRLISILLRKPDFKRRNGPFWTALVLQLVGVGLLGWIGWVHWFMWQHFGYKNIHVAGQLPLGPFFLVDAIGGVALAVVMLAWPRVLTGIVSAGFAAGTLTALLISLNVGLLGFHESTQASFVVQTMWFESVALVILAAWTVLTARTAATAARLAS
jgi:hypothetical protein